MSVLTCNIKVDGTTLAWLDGVLTTVANGVPVVPESAVQSPCGGFKYNGDVFRVEKHVFTLVDTEGVPADHFTVCGGVMFDAAVFEFNDGVLSKIPAKNSGDSTGNAGDNTGGDKGDDNTDNTDNTGDTNEETP